MDESARSKRSGVLWLLKFIVFIAVLYGIDHTPLRPVRVVAFFHLGTFGAFIFGLFGVVALWYVAEVILGFVVLLVGLTGLAFGSSALRRRSSGS